MINAQPVITGIKTMIDMFSLQFMQNAFLAGMMLSFVLAVVSFFVVLRRLSFIGVGVAHSAFGGVALGALLGISPKLLPPFLFLEVQGNGNRHRHQYQVLFHGSIVGHIPLYQVGHFSVEKRHPFPSLPVLHICYLLLMGNLPYRKNMMTRLPQLHLLSFMR